MAGRINQFEAEIAKRLEVAVTPDSPNRITAQEVRKWALEYLQDRDEELRRFPEEAGQLHWDLFMYDARFEDALFVVLVFQPKGVEFFCGTGDSFAVRHFCGHDFPEDPREMYGAMRERFQIMQAPLWLERQAAEEWLGRELDLAPKKE
jgi:hypothetical protein